MTHKCFLNNKKNLQKRFVASGIVTVFSTSLFSGYAEATQKLVQQPSGSEYTQGKSTGISAGSFLYEQSDCIRALFPKDIVNYSLKEIFGMDDSKIDEFLKDQVEEMTPNRGEFILCFFKYLKDKGCPLNKDLLDYFNKNKTSFQNAIRDVFE